MHPADVAPSPDLPQGGETAIVAPAPRRSPVPLDGGGDTLLVHADETPKLVDALEAIGVCLRYLTDVGEAVRIGDVDDRALVRDYLYARRAILSLTDRLMGRELRREAARLVELIAEDVRDGRADCGCRSADEHAAHGASR